MQMNITVFSPEYGKIAGFIHIEYKIAGMSSLTALGEKYPETLTNQCKWPHTCIHQLLQENNWNSLREKKCLDHLFFIRLT